MTENDDLNDITKITNDDLVAEAKSADDMGQAANPSSADALDDDTFIKEFEEYQKEVEEKEEMDARKLLEAMSRQELTTERLALTMCRDGLLERIQGAEDYLEDIPALLEEYKLQGKWQDYEELDSCYEQSYRDYTKILRQLGAIEEDLRRLETVMMRFDEYLRDTSFFPGLK